MCIRDRRTHSGRNRRLSQEVGPGVADGTRGIERGSDVFPAEAEVQSKSRANLDISLEEGRAVVSAVVVLHLAAGCDALAGLDGLDVAAAGRAEVAVGAEPEEEIAEGLEGEFAARGAGVVAPVGLGEEEAAGAGLMAAVDPSEVVAPGIVLVLGGEVVAQRAE